MDWKVIEIVDCSTPDRDSTPDKDSVLGNDSAPAKDSAPMARAIPLSKHVAGTLAGILTEGVAFISAIFVGRTDIRMANFLEYEPDCG
ncbi:MAG: hypothetical protein WCQ52_03180 [Actinomycetes bacterium]